MLHSVNQLKLNQTWKLSAKKNYNTSIQAKLPPLWRVSNTISLLLQLNFPRKQLVWKWKKKKSTHRYQTSNVQGKRGTGIFCHEQCGQVPRTFGSVLSHSNHGNSLGFSHIWFPQKDLCRKKKIIRVDRVTILRGFLLTLIEIITKYVRETLFSTLAFDLEPLVY